MEKLRNSLQAFAEKMNNIVFLQILQKAFSMIINLLMVGSFFSLFQGLPIDAWQNFIKSNGLYDVLGLPYTYTYGYISLYLSFCVAYQYALAKRQRKNALSIGIISMVAYLLTCPNPVGNWIGTFGMFTAIIVGFFTGWFCKLFYDNNITIKMPEGVPPIVAQAFAAIIPSFCLLVLFVIVNFVFGKTSLNSLNEAVYALIRVPVQGLSSNWLGEQLIFLYCSVLWFFGIHGGLAVMPITEVMFQQNKAENLAAYAAQQALPHKYVGATIGAATYAVAISIWLFSKRKDLKKICKVGFIPALFCIQEPLSFGIPTIMNPIFAIPYIFGGVITKFIAWFFQDIGFLPYNNCVGTPFSIPASIKNFINYGWKGVVVYLICTAVVVLFYAPFVKANDAALEAKEKASLED